MDVSGEILGGSTLPNMSLCWRLLRTSYMTSMATSSSTPMTGRMMAMGSQLGELLLLPTNGGEGEGGRKGAGGLGGGAGYE